MYTGTQSTLKGLLHLVYLALASSMFKNNTVNGCGSVDSTSQSAYRYARYSMYTKKNSERPESYLSSLSVAIILAIPLCPTVLSFNASTSRCHVGTPLFITWSVF